MKPFGLALLFASACLGFAAAADISTLTGKKHQGEVTAINDGVMTVRTEGGPVGVAVKDVFVVDYGRKVEVPAKDAKYDELELIDGSVIRTTGLLIKGKAVEVTLLQPPGEVAAPTMTIPMETIFSFSRNADDAKARLAWKKVLSGRGKRDLFVLKVNDDLTPVAGTVLTGNAAGDAIEYEKEDGGKVTFKLSRATGGLVFNQPPRGQIPPTLCKVIDLFGNTLIAKDVQVTKAGVKVTTVAGAVFEYPVAALAKLDFSQGNISYLSDMEAVVTAPQPVAGEPYFTYLRDKNQDGGQLKLDGVSYAKGLWVYPDTTLTYKLGGDFRELKMLVGIDESVPVANSTARLVITADGKELFAAKVSRKDAAKALNLDVKGVKELRITLERDGLYLGNQINLAEARVQK
ncbi:NPCBM/NEW2 domain-containing protein [Limnoglobus roseus]|uniref:NPCBM containing protein n=1 Tax=Limnoglobus roseus TaxID=2598579 RepID=A0A5C1A5Q7_9BACT|nr:NPCBM/NEW2 domain-containing protein [Limnoglobus roseus]QEL14030.1 NPCBM containing protein [Limnoglobus roseus]